MTMTPFAWALLAYLSLQFIITIVVSRTFVKTETDYLLAGRGLGVFLAGMSIFATWFGAETVMASSGAVASGGLAETRNEPFGYALCLVLMATLMASRMRGAGFVTMADFYVKRFSPTTGKIAAVVMIPTSLVWAAAQIMAFGAILSSVFGVSLDVGLLIGVSFVIFYTSLSGLMGDVVTDNLEGIIVVIGLVIILGLVLHYVGGIEAAVNSVDPARFNLLKADETWGNQINTWTIAIMGSLASQEIMSRILATKDAKTAKNSCLLGMCMYLTVGLIPVTIGMIGNTIIPIPEESDKFLPLLADHLLPPVLHVIFMGALISAILSTINSNLLAISALAGQTLIFPLKPNLSDRARLRWDRIFVIVAGVGAYLVAKAGDSIYELLTMSSSIGSAGLVVVVLIGLWTGLGGPVAAIATLFTGITMTFLGDFLMPWDNAYLWGLAACATVFVSVSLLERMAGHPQGRLPKLTS